MTKSWKVRRTKHECRILGFKFSFWQRDVLQTVSLSHLSKWILFRSVMKAYLKLPEGLSSLLGVGESAGTNLNVEFWTLNSAFGSRGVLQTVS